MCFSYLPFCCRALWSVLGCVLIRRTWKRFFRGFILGFITTWFLYSRNNTGFSSILPLWLIFMMNRILIQRGNESWFSTALPTRLRVYRNTIRKGEFVSINGSITVSAINKKYIFPPQRPSIHVRVQLYTSHNIPTTWKILGAVSSFW